MKYIVNDDCIGCGLCAGICPEVFALTDGGMAAAITAEIPDAVLGSAEEAKDGCPVSAIEKE